MSPSHETSTTRSFFIPPLSSFVTRRLAALDWWIIACVALLVLTGLLMLWSTATGGAPVDASDLAYQRFTRQTVTALVGLVLMIVVAVMLDPQSLERIAVALFIVSAILLALVAFIGTEVSSTRGWFRWGSFSFQPVELAKLAFIVFFAKVMKSWSRHLKEGRALFWSALGTVVSVGLLLLQPDFGGALVFIAVWAMMLVIVGIQRRHLALLTFLALVAMALAWSFFAPYQQERLLTFINPNRDPSGSGYNLVQSRIAVGSGGLFGRGVGYGPQSQLHFLPERQTDFLFAVIAEELGLVGASFVLGLWFAIFWRFIRTLEVVRDDFMTFLLLAGILLMAFELTMNVGMNVGLLPVVGLPLPLVSYGGSSLIVHLLLLGIMLNVMVESQRSHLLL